MSTEEFLAQMDAGQPAVPGSEAAPVRLGAKGLFPDEGVGRPGGFGRPDLTAFASYPNRL